MRDFLTANYHTHTVRCRHAYDSEREYIETAIKMGIKNSVSQITYRVRLRMAMCQE